MDHGQAHGFSGPKCWIVTAILGAVIGVVIGFLAPAQPGSGAHADAEAPRVIQTSPDGTKVERMLDGSTRPYVENAPVSAPAPAEGAKAHAEPHVPVWLCVPFAVLLASIALMPFVSAKFWHAHFPDFAFFLGSMVLAYYLTAFGSFGQHEMLHVGIEYYSFIALVGGLYVASGGVLIDIRDRGTPLRNTLLLAVGAVLANLLGTTGASVLLIRPFMRMNRGRLRPIHVVFFIFIVSNCAGCLTPIGDPPLYLGFLKGVPFFWTLTTLWPMWLAVNGMLLALFFIVDSRIPRANGSEHQTPFDSADRTPIVSISPSLICLLLLVGGVFIDPMLKTYAGISGIPIGATFQIVMAILAYALTKPSIRHANQFTFEPVKEVGFLFIGIFLTMAPALGFLRANATQLGLETPTQYYFLTGALSAVLDNAPTYLSFLQVAMGTLHMPLTPEGIQEFIRSTYDLTHATGANAGESVRFNGFVLLEAISLGAVFFGAMTYIGNGPNFMVKSIVDSAHAAGQAKDAAPGQETLGTRMPSFFGYVLYAVTILLPVLVVNWFIFIR